MGERENLNSSGRDGLEWPPHDDAQAGVGGIWVVGRQPWLADLVSILRDRFAIMTIALGKEVWKGLAIARPALLVLGNAPPDLSVVELCRTVRADKTRRRLSILYVADAGPSGREQGDALLAAGANRVLQLPLSERAVLETVRLLTNVAPRARRRLPVRIERGENTPAPEGRFVTAMSFDVSATGMLLQADQLPTVGERLRLRFHVPGREQEIETEASVVRREIAPGPGPAFALEYLGMPPADRKAVAEFVETQVA